MAASSSSSSQKCDVFPSFRGEDVRTGFLSHLQEALDRSGLINTFKDHGIERSRPIGPELLSAIREARISIVIFSKNYASSKWCLDELAEIHNCFQESNQMVIPVFYDVDPSEVRKQNGEFGKSFMKTCEGKTDDVIQRWKEALTDVANLAGEHLQNWSDEASMVKKIANDVFNKLLPPFNGFGDFVGIEVHIKAMESILCLESEEPRMIGIWGQSGIGKSTLGRALFSHFSPKFPLYAFLTYKSTNEDVFGLKLRWEKQLLVEIFKKNIEVDRLGMVERMLKHKKVLIVLDDVFKPLFLETLVGKTEWFGPGSRIIVISQDKHLLEAHKIDDLYEVKIPAPVIALKMLCRSAFGQDYPPDDFKELAVEVAKVAGNLPLGLSVLGSSLKGRTKEEWMKLLPGLQNGLKGDIMKILKVSYDRLYEEEQDIFLWIASIFNGGSVKCINDFFGDSNGCVEIWLKRLEEKSLIRTLNSEEIDWVDAVRRRIGPNEETVEMHNLLEKLGREIVCAESKSDPGKRRFLTDAKEIEDVLTNQIGTETVLGIFLKASAPDISIDEKSFEAMLNLQFLRIDNDFSSQMDEPQLRQPNGLVYLPQKLKWVDWNDCPFKCLPSNFKAEFLVELRMMFSNIEKLWEGTQQLGSLKTILMSHSKYLIEIPDLSKAVNLETIGFDGCPKLESFPSPLNWESLEYLDLRGCNSLQNFPQITMARTQHGIEIEVYDCLWNMNLRGLDYLDCLRRCYPLKFLPEHIVHLEVKGIKMEKFEGVQSLGSLRAMNLSYCEKLKEIPNLSKATNIKYLSLWGCKSLVTLPSTIGNLQKLETLDMKYCKGLEVLPVDVNLSSLKTLDLYGCSSLKNFPQVSLTIEYLCLDHTSIEEVPCLIEMLPRLIRFSMGGCLSLKSFPQLPHSIESLNLDYTSIEEVPCCIEMFRRLTRLSMRACSKLKNISPNIFRLTNLKQVNFTGCEGIVTTSSDGTLMPTIEDSYVENRRDEDENDDKKFSGNGYYPNRCCFLFQHCLKLDRDARELIIQSSFKWTMVLPGGEVPTYFNHQANGNSLTVILPQSSHFHEFLRFNVCVVVKPLTGDERSLNLHFRFNGTYYMHILKLVLSRKWKADHIVLCSFKIRTTDLPSTLDFNDIEFKFNFKHVGVKESSRRIKKVGIRLLNVSSSSDDRDGRSSETECNIQSGEKSDVVEIESSNKQMQISSLTSPNMEFLLGRQGESSSVSSYPCPEGEVLCIDSIITEQEDAQLPVVDQSPEPDLIWQSSSSTSSCGASMFSCWGGLLKKKEK